MAWLISAALVLLLSTFATASPGATSDADLEKQLVEFGGKQVPMQVALYPNGKMECNGTPCTPIELRQRLAAIRGDNARQIVVVVAGDDVSNKQIRDVIKTCADVGLTRVLHLKKLPPGPMALP
jgi:biopolymer transport protein ExbD